jgi:hypothetical protein
MSSSPENLLNGGISNHIRMHQDASYGCKEVVWTYETVDSPNNQSSTVHSIVNQLPKEKTDEVIALEKQNDELKQENQLYAESIIALEKQNEEHVIALKKHHNKLKQENQRYDELNQKYQQCIETIQLYRKTVSDLRVQVNVLNEIVIKYERIVLFYRQQHEQPESEQEMESWFGKVCRQYLPAIFG